MVDYEPWLGNYTGTTVFNNTILGGFADVNPDNNSSYGMNSGHAIIKYVFLIVIRGLRLETDCCEK